MNRGEVADRTKKGKLSAGKGSVAHIVTTMVCILAMMITALSYCSCVALLERKAAISQVARKYILRMETIGYLTEKDCQQMTAELSALGAVELDFTGSTQNEVGYGSPITLCIRGKLEGNGITDDGMLSGTFLGTVLYEFSEIKMSTAKN